MWLFRTSCMHNKVFYLHRETDNLIEHQNWLETEIKKYSHFIISLYYLLLEKFIFWCLKKLNKYKFYKKKLKIEQMLNLKILIMNFIFLSGPLQWSQRSGLLSLFINYFILLYNTSKCKYLISIVVTSK